MYIARVLYPVKVLGPGNRIGIWFNGCIHHCKNCSNPELWDVQEKYYVEKEHILSIIRQIAQYHRVDGFTITGGDPFYQPEALLELVRELETITEDILIYTGYSFEEVLDKHKEIIDRIAVLIDGPYIEEKNNNSILRGSDNQRIIICKDQFRNIYEQYLVNTTNQIQNFSLRDGIISVGIHRRRFEEDLRNIMEVEERKK